MYCNHFNTQCKVILRCTLRHKYFLNTYEMLSNIEIQLFKSSLRLNRNIQANTPAVPSGEIFYNFSLVWGSHCHAAPAKIAVLDNAKTLHLFPL